MIEIIGELLASLPKELYIFIISLLPIIELRGAIPVGAALGLPFYLNYPLSVIGNLLPVPFILAFIPMILDFIGRFRLFRPIVNWLREKAEKNKGKIIKEETAEDTEAESAEQLPKPKKRCLTAGVFLALMIFVAIPLPGTGAWTGSLVAALFDMPKRSSFLAITLGVMISGVIMCLASYGVIGFLSIFI